MNWITKMITKYIALLIFTSLSFSAYATSGVDIYTGSRANLALVNDSGTYTLLAYGGAINRGVATSGACFIKAEIAIKKKPNYYEGNFDPVHNSVATIDELQVQGKGMGLYMFPKKIEVGGTETTGICADHISFSGDYKLTPPKSHTYDSTFLFYLKLVHENALHLYKNNKLTKAIESLRPFVDQIIEGGKYKILNSDIIPAINDYAFFLQKNGQNKTSLKYFQMIIDSDPDRVVALLNAADSYWKLSEKSRSAALYKKYNSLMNKNNKSNRIPKRALTRSKYCTQTNAKK